MIEQIELQKTFEKETALRQWLIDTAKHYDLNYLLAFDEEGVIWGKFDDNQLVLASEALPNISEIHTPLRTKTLRQARLFGKKGEVLLWSTGNGFKARFLKEDKPEGDEQDDPDVFTETYWLWGQGMLQPNTDGSSDFTLMHEGKQGLRHAPPLPDAINKRGGLIVKHHLEYDAKGQAYIARSRLAGLEIVQEEKNGD